MIDPLAKKPPPPGRRISIALAVAVHVVLALFLIYGVHWQNERPEAVAVELVVAQPAPAVEPPPESKPEPVPEPQPATRIEPKPAPPPPKPEIAIKEKKEKQKPPPKVEPPPRFDPAAGMLKREDEDLAARRLSEAAARELANLEASKATQARTARDKAVASWQGKIATKIKGNIVRPSNATGNPEAIFEITLLPDGSLVGEPRLKKSTGNAALDTAIERAIRKSEPLPKPDDPSVFQRLIELKFRPLDDSV